MSDVVRLLNGAQTVRSSLLQRRRFEEFEVSPALEQSLARVFGRAVTPEEAVSEIIQHVSRRGDAALREYTRRIEGVELEELRLPAQATRRAYEAAAPELRAALELAAARIRAFHERQPRQSWLEWSGDGALGQMVRPLRRVGVYVPGGQAPLASTLLMAAIPARVAGVETVIVCSPPRRDTGAPDSTVLAAAHVAGVDEVYAIGGAQAIAAMAMGTETLPRVDKIVGPGNIFVVLAKKALFGTVGIESLPGPTETLIVADDAADPCLAAADMLAQAEHVLASAILLTPSLDLAQGVRGELARRLEGRDDLAEARRSLATRGGIGVVADLAEALALANEYAPEHLCLLTRDPWALLPLVLNAGGVFLGELASEALGDYVVGPSHIMPTGGTARFASPLNVWDFVKITSVFAPGAADVGSISPSAATLAQAEGLVAHRDAILLRGAGDREP